jgi:hypothetical protein
LALLPLFQFRTRGFEREKKIGAASLGEAWRPPSPLGEGGGRSLRPLPIPDLRLRIGLSSKIFDYWFKLKYFRKLFFFSN